MGLSVTHTIPGVPPVVSHSSMPPQPTRPTSMATAAPVKKLTPPMQTNSSNPPTPSISVPTPPPSVTPTNTETAIPSPGIMRTPQGQTNVGFPIVNHITNDTSIINQQSDIMQPYNSLGKLLF